MVPLSKYEFFIPPQDQKSPQLHLGYRCGPHYPRHGTLLCAGFARVSFLDFELIDTADPQMTSCTEDEFRLEDYFGSSKWMNAMNAQYLPLCWGP